MKPTLVLVGRPNVGKSTLFNRLTRSRDALVADLPGLTRDRHYGAGKIGGKSYIVVDTGGLEPAAKEGVLAEMAKQTHSALAEADVVLFLVDARDGVTAQDQRITTELRRLGRKVWLVVNKAEGLNAAQACAEFSELGLGDPTPISASHGEGVSELMDTVLADYDDEEEDDNNNEEDIDGLYEQINHQQTEIDILKQTIEKLLNRQCSNNFTIQQIINNNNINNINNNNLYVNINSFGKENLSHITEKDYKKYMSGFFPGFIKFIEKIHFDINMPENHNIYITNLKSRYTTIYDNENKKWLTKNKDEIIDNLIRKNYNILDGKCDEFEEKEINDDVIKKFRTFQKNYIDEESQKNTKNDVMLLLYNNRDKVEKVKKIK